MASSPETWSEAGKARHKALAPRFRDEENFSSSDEEVVSPKKTVGKIKKSILGDTSTSLQRRMAILKKKETYSSDEEVEEPKETVGKIKKISSSDDNNFPKSRRKVTTERLRQKVKLSSSDDELELNITVGKFKKPSHKITKNIPGDTSNSVQECKRELETLATKMDELISLVQSMSNRNKQVEHVLCQVADKNDIHHNLT